MTSLTALRPPSLLSPSASSFSFPALFPRRFASLPPLFSPAPLRITREPFPRLGLHLSSPLGFGSKKESGGKDNDFNLEAEIYGFMERSKNPSAFPTREELIAAGRADLAEAIVREGGWFTFGWNLEREDEQQEDDAGISQQRSQNGSLAADSWSSSDRSMEMEAEEEAGGIQGILSRLESERSLAYGFSSVEKRVNGKASWRNEEHDGEDAVLITNGKAVGRINRNSRSMSSDLDEQLVHTFGSIHSHKGTLEDASGTCTMPMWRIWSLQRTGNRAMKFEAAEIVSNEDRHDMQKFSDDVSVDKNQVAWTVSKMGEEESKGSKPDAEEICQKQIHLRLKHLESELTSVLHLLRSISKGAVSFKDHEISLEELHRLSDELEFKQTEIMNAKDKLRSIQAKLAVQQGKMTLVIMEAQKGMDVRKKRLDAAQKTLCLLRSVRIVWPNSASEVLLAGSFDGWSSQWRMDRSKSGIFTLRLKLYPGRHEIKFIVDGVWMIDPLRPIICSNGYENNLLVIT